MFSAPLSLLMVHIRILPSGTGLWINAFRSNMSSIVMIFGAVRGSVGGRVLDGSTLLLSYSFDDYFLAGSGDCFLTSFFCSSSKILALIGVLFFYYFGDRLISSMSSDSFLLFCLLSCLTTSSSSSDDLAGFLSSYFFSLSNLHTLN